MKIRPANPSEVAVLDRIAFEAKAYWGYPAEQLSLWEPELATRPESVNTWPTLVAELEDHVVGFAQVDPTGNPWELVALWVLPGYMRGGVGKALLVNVLQRAARANQKVLAIDSDPNAAGFYQSFGAQLQGKIDAPIPGDPGRYRPQYLLATDARPAR